MARKRCAVFAHDLPLGHRCALFCGLGRRACLECSERSSPMPGWTNPFGAKRNSPAGFTEWDLFGTEKDGFGPPVKLLEAI
jgi:hypothetical protein